MRKHMSKRLLSLVLAVVLCLSLVLPAAATGVSNTPKVTFEQVDNSAVSAAIPGREPVELPEIEDPYNASDMVRVSIVLEKEGTIEAGFSPVDIAENSAAMNYRAELKQEQVSVMSAIRTATEQTLDVVWNLTLAANIISANVRYGDIKAIEAVNGVEEVLIETQYAPCVVNADEADDPNMATSSKQIGSSAVWAAGYTGAGTRIAIIDTGTDIEHQSFDAGAFEYSLAQLAEEAGMTYDAYVETLDLLDAEEIAGVVDQLNLPINGNAAYINSKLPYGVNYVDKNYNVVHVLDGQGEHGSHVAGIATANAYVANSDGTYSSALDTVRVQGVAPDAQLLTMKVFGKNGGAYDSDYMAAIEDAIVLGADAVNLSLGSAAPGFSREVGYEYQQIMDGLVESGVVVAMSIGNSGYWSESALNGIPYLYLDDVSMHTGGSPGTYTNSLAVASVDNAGWSAPAYLNVGENVVSYSESVGYSNKPIATLAGTQEYVFLNNIGTPEQWSALGVDLKGKIAVCYRGEISFSEKANAAAEAGAIGVVIVNNDTGIINMDLSDYQYEAPCVSILQADGEYFKEYGTVISGEGVNGWIGTLEVCDEVVGGEYDSEYYTMSAFSSWGVSGSLELKPEITAPGGSIFSVAGANVTEGQQLFMDHKSYENMSGTSMASPQIAGMAALMAQYVEKEGLAAKTGLDERALIQSLLMSTAEPMRDGASGGNYYPVIQQGAGLANVGKAVAADSYILMDADATASYADGKVKAELGDDPDKDGVYSFSFTINNLTDEERIFALSADVFTQGGWSYSGIDLMDTWTEQLNPVISWTVNGQSVDTDADLFGLDFNGDGLTNTADGQALLDYATGARTELTNEDQADLDEDGDIDSYDAYIFFKLLGESGASVPANGSAKVAVTIELSDSDREKLAAYENGAYIEAYVYAETMATEEGVAGTVHSIPVLGFYGNWTDPSMFDKGSYLEYVYGEENRYPYLMNGFGETSYSNSLTMTFAGDSSLYYFGGNPIVKDEVYDPERNALNSENGDAIAKWYYTAIRNAAASRLTITDVETGAVYKEVAAGAKYSAYYNANSGTWAGVVSNQSVGWSGTDSNGAPLEEGTTVELAWTLVPELYVKNDGTVNWDALGDGVSLKMQLTIDNTAPVLNEGAVAGSELTVTAMDNRHVAAVALLDPTGSRVLAFAGAEQDEVGAVATSVLDVTGVVGKNFMLQIFDYAGNVSTWQAKYEELASDLDAQYAAFNQLDANWYGVDESGENVEVVGQDTRSIYAAEYVDGYVFAYDNVNDYYANLYVMPSDDLANYTKIATLESPHGEDFYIADMAYNYADGNMYFLFYSDNDESDGGAYPYLATVDLLSGEVQVLGMLAENMRVLAIDGDGVFYGIDYNYDLYSYTVTNGVATMPEKMNDEPILTVAEVPGQSSLTWDSKNNALIFADNRAMYIAEFDFFLSESLALKKIDLDKLEVTVLNPEMPGIMLGLHTANDGLLEDNLFEETDTPVSVTITQEAIELKVSETAQLDASVAPWTLTNRGLVWSSDDPSVVVVNANGVITAKKNGTATIKAASVLDGTVYDTCTVTVTSIELDMQSIIWDEKGDAWWSTFNPAGLPDYTKRVSNPEHFASATMSSDGFIYAATLDTDAYTSNLYKVDPETLEATEIGPISDVAAMDLAEAPNLNPSGNGYMLGVYGPYVLVIDKVTGTYLGAFEWNTELVGIAYGGSVLNTYYNDMIDTFFLIDAEGNVYYEAFMDMGESMYYFYGPEDGLMLNAGMDTQETVYFNSACYTVDNNGTPYLFWAQFAESADEVNLLAIDVDLTGKVYNLGTFPASVWPVTGLMAENIPALSSTEKVADMVTAQVDTENAAVMGVEIERISADTVKGGLNSIAAVTEPMSGTDTNHLRNTLTLELTAMGADGLEIDTTNGVQNVTYNTDDLLLKSVVVNGDYRSINRQDADGKVTIGYVDLDSLAAGETTATLVFEAISSGATTIKVDHEEVNNEAGGEEVLVDLVLDIPDEDPEDPDFPDLPDVPDLPGFLPGLGAIGGLGGGVGIVPPFVDVAPSDWFYNDVAYVYENGLMNGTSGNRFDPNGSLTRAMVVTILWRMEGSPMDAQDNTFADVEAYSWYENAVDWASAFGIVQGYNETTFGPNDPVTREQLATILWRYAKYKGYDVSVKTSIADFNDASSVSEYAVPAMQWAYATGLINGANGNLMPRAGATRAQVAAIIHRFLEG